MSKTRKFNKRYCVVNGCLNNNRDKPNLSLFQLPKDLARRIKWLQLIEREDLLSIDDLKYYSYEVCSDHFAESDMKTVRQLYPNVLPSRKIGMKEGKSSASTSNKEFEIANIFSFSDTTKKLDDLDKIKDEIKNELPEQNYVPKPTKPEEPKLQLLSKIQFEKTEIKLEFNEQGETDILPDNADNLTENFNILVNLQNILENQYEGKDNDAFKMFALKLHYSSPHMYTSLQPWLKLPSKSTLSRLITTIPPNLDDATFESLSIKIKSLPAKAKYCSICVDEIELKPNLYYDLKSDEVIGFEFKGDLIYPAKYAYVIVLQSLYFDWKQPITYNLCATAKSHTELDVFITEAITKLFCLDISIIGLIINEKQIFQQYAASKKVTIGHPYFFIDGRIIYCIFDIPSLLKCLHKDFISTRFYDANNEQIWWEFIKYICTDQRRRNINLTPKLTFAHIEPDVKKMTVEQSAQIFSNTVSSALETYIAFDEISKDAKATATFIKTVNDLFDVLNSDKDEAKAGFTIEEQVRVLGDAYTMFSTMKTSEENSTDIRTCQLFLVTIQSMQHLFEELKFSRLSHFYTRRLNQDCIADLLKCANKSGYKPTPMQFTRAFSKCFLKNMLKNNPSRKLDTNEILKMAKDVMKNETTIPAPHKSLVSLEGETDYRMDLPDRVALIYVASYLIIKCSQQHECYTFQKALNSMPSLYGNILFDNFKEFNSQSSFHSSLKLPPEEFIQYICKLEATLFNNFNNCIHGKLGSSLYELLRQIPMLRLCICFPSEYLLKLFVRFRIYDILKFNNCLYRTYEAASLQSVIMKKLIV